MDLGFKTYIGFIRTLASTAMMKLTFRSYKYKDDLII